MKVYIVVHDYQDELTILAVCSSEKIAREWIDNDKLYSDTLKIEKWVVNND